MDTREQSSGHSAEGLFAPAAVRRTARKDAQIHDQRELLDKRGPGRHLAGAARETRGYREEFARLTGQIGVGLHA